MESEVLKFSKGIFFKKGLRRTLPYGSARAVAVVYTWPACNPPCSGRDRPTGRPICDVANGCSCGTDGRGSLIGRPHSLPRPKWTYFFLYKTNGQAVASLLLFPLSWQDKLGVIFD